MSRISRAVSGITRWPLLCERNQEGAGRGPHQGQDRDRWERDTKNAVIVMQFPKDALGTVRQHFAAILVISERR